MADQLQHKNSAGCDETTLPAEFDAVCVLAFLAGVLATVYFCRSMCCEMEMGRRPEMHFHNGGG